MAYVVALIPARAGSKGVPNKNIRPLNGHPLLAYSVRAGVITKGIDRTLVTTDSPEYRDICLAYGAEVPFLRPVEIAGDKATDLEYVLHALDWLQQEEKRVPDFIVQLRPTTPMRDPALVQKAIDVFTDAASATALRSIHEMSETAYKCFEVDNGRLKCVGSGSYDVENSNRPRQSFPATYHPNGYVDILRTSYIRDMNKLHGDRVAAFVTPRAVEVDTQEDFDEIEFKSLRQADLLKTLFS
jgi:N-acylneuraminate cytidylyltransferase